MNFPAGITEQERALMAAAYIVMRHGSRFAGLLDRCEGMIEAGRQGDLQRDRASRILRQFTREVRDASGA